MCKIKNAQNLDIQTVLYKRIQEDISLLYFDDQNSATSGQQEKKPIWDFKKKKKTAITRFDTPNTGIFHSAATYKEAPGVTF